MQNSHCLLGLVDTFVWNSMESFLTFRMQNMFQIFRNHLPCGTGWYPVCERKKKFHRNEHWWADFWSAGQSATITAKWNAYLATSIHKPFHWRDTSSSHGSRYLEHICYRVCLQNAALLSTFLPKIRPSQYTFPKAYHSGYTMYLSFFLTSTF